MKGTGILILVTIIGFVLVSLFCFFIFPHLNTP
ncbi:hypothetical protein [Bacillus sp. B4EP4a]